MTNNSIEKIIFGIIFLLFGMPLYVYGNIKQDNICSNFIKVETIILNSTCTILPPTLYQCDIYVSYVLKNSTLVISNITTNFTAIPDGLKIILYYSKTDVLNLNLDKCGDYKYFLNTFKKMIIGGSICIIIAIFLLCIGIIYYEPDKSKNNNEDYKIHLNTRNTLNEPLQENFHRSIES
jgi:hypothetical protein